MQEWRNDDGASPFIPPFLHSSIPPFLHFPYFSTPPFFYYL
jgi:hypothetical protein